MTVTVSATGRAAPIRVKLSTINTTAVYTCPSDRAARAIALRCVNTSVGAISITVTIIDTVTTYTFYPTTPLAAGAVIDFDMSGHPFKPTESLNVQASGADTIQVIGMMLEASM